MGKEFNLRVLKYSLWYERPDLFFLDMTGKKPNVKQAEILMSLKDLTNSRYLITAARSTGKTILMAVIALWSAVPLAAYLGYPYKVSILSGSLEQSKVLYDYITDFLRQPMIRDFIDGEVLVTESHFISRGWIVALPASEKTVLSKHCDLLIIDEACVEGLQDGRLIKKSMPLISASAHPRLILGSTPYEFMSYFVELWLEDKKYPEFKRFSWAFSDCPWISLEEARFSQSQMTAEEFEIHWRGVPTPLLGAFIPIDDLRKCTPELVPETSGTVQAGIDWGLVDPTVVAISSFETDGSVVLRDIRTIKDRNPDNQLDKVETVLLEYPVTKINADSSAKSENIRLRTKGYLVKEVVFKNEKPRMQANMRSKIVSHTIIIPRCLKEYQILVDELRVYTQDTHTNDHHVDAFQLSLLGDPKGQLFYYKSSDRPGTPERDVIKTKL